MRRLLFGLFVLLLPASVEAQISSADSAFFLRVTQQMIDAITTGDTTTWARVLAPEWIETDEEGHYITRAELLASLHPLPPGQQGVLKVDRWRFMGGQGTVVLTYDIDEVHHYYGQTLITTFHSTDTWVKRRGRWWQIATQQTAFPRAVDGEPIASAEAAEYAGSYALTPTIQVQIVPDDSGFTVGRTGGPRQRLYQLTKGIFVRHGVRGFWVFERGADGRVARAVNWRDNNRVAYERTR